jgi:hypothetical protein
MLAGTGHETGGAVATAVQPAQRSESDYNLGHPPDLRTSDSSSTTSNDRFTGQSCAKPYGSEGRGSPKPNNGIADSGSCCGTRYRSALVRSIVHRGRAVVHAHGHARARSQLSPAANRKRAPGD